MFYFVIFSAFWFLFFFGISLFPPSILLFLCSRCPPYGLSFLFASSICPFLHLFLLSFSVPILSHPSSFLPPPSLPTVGKWHVVRVPAWTGTPLGVVALRGQNSPAPVVMWTSSRRLQQQHLSCSPPSTSIRKMDKPPFNASLIGREHSRDKLSNTER